ncbi:UV-damage endonuclease [Paenibacillus cellulosilyticus]|uniref:UV-damage endonuclease n=1 Tax=Paenibacillus cellulosilyticus TaxID=375489 RepID=A0A2V2YRS5_9BACL|nr:UV DNA damage repair endonuclease UvsE [Paenibacillus cellulosilyticus]PWV97942.1 UV-damage endonuclease [Paenibacillus cellulosilyticus]QKS44023.1 UV DNA damage repair endonuclease UvsE [Paenibacillus cellulosilyticus]
MIVRFGFVAMSMLLESASPSRTMTYANFSKLDDREAALRKLERLAEENLNNTLRLLRHCRGSGIQMYRFSSKLIPLATHDAVKDWDPFPALADKFAEIGAFVRESGMRVSFHPDHFCVFSTPRPEVLASSRNDMIYHVRMLEAMGLDESAKNNIHVGGAYGDKQVAGERFIRQFGELDARLRNRVTLENDDKTFNVRETLDIAEAVQIPMVLDIHHHAVNDGGESEESLIGDLWPRIVGTWHRENDRLSMNADDDVVEKLGAAAPLEAASGSVKDWPGGAMVLPPKIHASSPKSVTDPRGHADYVEPEQLLRFLQSVSGSVPILDCMLEAKRKDDALFRLMDDFRAMEARGERLRVVGPSAIEV